MKAPFTGHFRRSMLFWQLTLSYTLLIIVPLIMGIVIVSFTNKNLLRQSQNTNKAQLEYTMETIENSLSVVNDLSDTLSTNTEIIEFLNKSYANKGELTYSIMEMRDNLSPLKDSNQLIDGYFLFSMKNQSMVSPDQGFTSAEMYYKKYYHYSDMNYYQFQEDVLKRKLQNKILPPQPFVYGSDKGSSILYINSLYNKSNKMIGQAVFRINAEKIKDLMLPAISKNSGNMFISDQNRSLLLSYAEDRKLSQALAYKPDKDAGSFERNINGTMMFISYQVSEKTGWTYMITVPSKVLYSQAKNVIRTIIIFLIIMYGVAIAIAFFSLKRNRKPLLSMANNLPSSKLPSEKLMKNGVSYISSVVTDMVYDNEQLEERVKEQKILIRSMVLSKLESGEMAEEDWNRLSHQLNILADGKSYRGVYLLIRHNDNIKKPTISPGSYQKILDFLTARGEHLPVVSMKSQYYIMLYQQENEEDHQICYDFFRDIYRMLYNEYGFEAVICLGFPCESLLTVYQSFEAARHLLDIDAGAPSNYKFLLEAQLESEASGYFIYPEVMEQKLINLISTYNEQGIHSILADIFKKNFIERLLSRFMKKVLFYRILATIVPFTDMDDIASELKGSLANIDPTRFFELIENQCIQICEIQRQKNERSSQTKMEKVFEYIHENICDYNLTLNSLALQFNMPESYLSVCIKESAGMNFTNYVEEMRMKIANRLLTENKLSVAQIAEEVGYSNPHSFRRAYKRLYGCSPSQFRTTVIS